MMLTTPTNDDHMNDYFKMTTLRPTGSQSNTSKTIDSSERGLHRVCVPSSSIDGQASKSGATKRSSLYNLLTPICMSFIFIAMACTLTACHNPAQTDKVEEGHEATSADDHEDEHHEPAPVTLPTMRVRVGEVKKTLAIPGRVSALPDHSISITPFIQGKIKRLLVVPGQHVAKGQLIAELDDRQIQAQFKQALSPIDAADAAIRQADAEHEFSRRELKRLQDLYSNELVAKKDVLAQETLVETSNAKLAAARAKLKEVRAATSDEETLLKFTKIHSPITGVVAERFMNIGDEARPDSPIVHIVNLGEVIIDADMPADWPHKIYVGRKAEVRSVSEPNYAYKARIVSISPTVDLQKNTIKTRLQCVNNDGGLREGQAVVVTIDHGSPSRAILVPRSAVVPNPEDPKKDMIYIVKDGKSKQVSVVAGIETEQEIEIIDGLTEGDTIISSGGYGLPEGVEVKSKHE